MSQFCGSFAALINRSLLTVILYCAASWDAVSTVIETPAIAAQAKVTSLRLRYCMTAPPMKPPVRCDRRVAVATALTGTKTLFAKRPRDNAEGEARHFIDYTAAIETVS